MPNHTKRMELFDFGLQDKPYFCMTTICLMLLEPSKLHTPRARMNGPSVHVFFSGPPSYSHIFLTQ